MTTPPSRSLVSKVVLPDWVIAAGAFVIPCLLCIPRTGVAEIVVLLLAAGGALWIGHCHPIVERYLRQHIWQRWALLVGCSFLLATLAIGSTVFARWWIMDDHELAHMLGADHQIALGEVVQSLREHHEVGNIGASTRVRPAYFVIRHIEAWLWGDNLVLWYSARVIALGAIFTLCWHLLWKWFGGIDAGLIMLLIFCWRMWSDLWSRIGSSETYGMIGIALCILGVTFIESLKNASKWKNISAWSLITLGAIIAIGSKENFMIMVPATIGYAGWLWYRGKMSVSAGAGTLAVTAFGVFIALTVVGSLAASNGVDIYANKRSVGTLLQATARCLTTHLGLVMAIAVIGLLVFTRRIQGDNRYARILPQAKTITLALTALTALFVSQFAFYNDFDFFGSRYDFPAALGPLLMVPLLVYFWLQYRRARGDDRQQIRKTQLALRIAMVLLVGIMGLSMQRRSVRQVHRSTAFINEVTRVVEACKAEPLKPVVFVSHGPQDYESLYSVARFLRYYNVSNPLYLQLENYRTKTDQSLSSQLARNLQNVSDQGNVDFRPLNELTSGSESLGVGFSGKPAKISCVGEFPCWR